MTWIVTANSNLCRIYHFDKNPEKIDLIKEINHPENKLKKREMLTTDRPGHYQTDGSARGAYSPHSDPKAVEVDSFSREIALELNHGRDANAYSTLILVTPPHMNGLLAEHLNKHVKKLIKKEIQKDVMHLSHIEFLEFIRTHLKPV